MSIHAIATAIRRSRGVAALVAAAIILYLALVSVVPVRRTREQNLRDRVTVRLMQIEMAKQDLALKRSLEPGAVLRLEDLVGQSKYLSEMPVSEEGEYQVGAIGELARFVRPDGPEIVPARIGRPPNEETAAGGSGHDAGGES